MSHTERRLSPRQGKHDARQGGYVSGQVGVIPHRGKGRPGHVWPSMVASLSLSLNAPCKGERLEQAWGEVLHSAQAPNGETRQRSRQP
jgi:hypothetical protein